MECTSLSSNVPSDIHKYICFDWLGNRPCFAPEMGGIHQAYRAKRERKSCSVVHDGKLWIFGCKFPSHALVSPYPKLWQTSLLHRMRITWCSSVGCFLVSRMDLIRSTIRETMKRLVQWLTAKSKQTQWLPPFKSAVKLLYAWKSSLHTKNNEICDAVVSVLLRRNSLAVCNREVAAEHWVCHCRDEVLKRRIVSHELDEFFESW